MNDRLRALNFLKKERINIPDVAMLNDWGINKTQLTTFMKAQTVNNAELKFSKLSLGMFNATIDTGNPLSIPGIRDDIIKDGLPDDVISFVTRYGQFKVADEVVRNKPIIKKANVPNSKLFRADIIMRMTRNGVSKNVNISIYANGKIRFSGGAIKGDEPRYVVAWLRGTGLVKGLAGKQLVVNNFVGTFKINSTINTSLVHTIWDFDSLADFLPICDPGKNVFKFNGYAMSGYMNNKQLMIEFCNPFTEETFNVILSESGTVQLQGSEDINNAFDVAKKWLKALNRHRMLNGTAQNVPNVIPQQTSTKCPKPRRPAPYTFNGKCPKTHPTVKANPQGQPCCYKGKAKNDGKDLRRCMRKTKKELIDMAKTTGVNIPDKATKEVICKKLIKK